MSAAPIKRTSIAQVILASRQRLDALLADADTPHFQAELIMLAAQLQSACNRNRNVALAMTLLAQDTPYSTRHAIDVAVVVELALKRLGQSEAERRPVIAAALTMNIGMHALQPVLDSQSGPLTAEQRQAMQQHPLMGRDLLRQRGVSDTLWLDCVVQHHEAPDGSGYPQKLRDDTIRFEARLIGLADRYCALLSKSAWRQARSADAALFQSLSPASTDSKLDKLFVDTLGLYPPGTGVELASNEIGIVKRPGAHELTPIIQPLFDAEWRPLRNVAERDPAEEQYSILSVLDNDRLTGRVNPAQVWGEDAALA
ncbi:HD-GYP domain-containing protein [Andreprevotia chitinilytica]|uniref:HD-GYP domain-containing protein n=1 Tax=Andreprevotia chitinilytica TaxID=396808 RepID=UPI00068FC74D|nr:HD domain-containing phosphohydrolase [Andreprevotia chitinilytica]